MFNWITTSGLVYPITCACPEAVDNGEHPGGGCLECCVDIFVDANIRRIAEDIDLTEEEKEEIRDMLVQLAGRGMGIADCTTIFKEKLGR